MTEYRRKKYYIDKIFQNRFLSLFLTLAFFSLIANICFMHFYLKKDVESYIYKSHIKIQNVNESIINNLTNFNIMLIVIVLIVALIFYSLIRLKINHFFKKVYYALFIRLGNSEFVDFQEHLPKIFQDIDTTLAKLFKNVDTKIENEKKFINTLNEYIENQTIENLETLKNFDFKL